MKIAFVWYFDKSSDIYDNWRDGLRGALDEIGKHHQLSVYLGKSTPDPDKHYDFILLWDDSNSPFFEQIDNFKCRKGLCLTTNPHNLENLKKVDVVYTESSVVHDEVRRAGIRAIRAFGTDTDFFRPSQVKKDIKYFYPATFSPWKRQSEIAYLGSDLLCVGTIQPDGDYEYQSCIANGVKTEIGYFPARKIRNYYQRTQNMIIPAVHGSERTVLEAMASGIVPEVTHPIENAKTYSLVEEQRDSGLSPREFVEKFYSHKVYAEALMKGING